MLEQGPHLGSRDRPADILLLNWDAGKDTAADFVVAHPLAKSQHPLTPLKARRFLQSQEDIKRRHAEASGDLTRAGWSFIPLAFQTFACPGPSAQRLLHQVFSRATSDLEGWDKIRLLAEIRQTIVLAVARQVGEQLLLYSRVQDVVEPC
jgi:hypothetical protein